MKNSGLVLRFLEKALKGIYPSYVVIVACGLLDCFAPRLFAHEVSLPIVKWADYVGISAFGYLACMLILAFLRSMLCKDVNRSN